MAHKAAGGSSTNGRDSNSQRLGIKKYTGETVKQGGIIVRQRGSTYNPGKNVMKGSDDTIFATTPGIVSYLHKKVKRFTGKLEKRVFVNVEPTKN